MKSLISKIDLLNENLIVNIKGTHKFYGLTKETTRGDEKQNFEVKSKNQVIIDDTYGSFFYHKFSEIDYKTLQQRGKTRTYIATASIKLICYSNEIDFDDHIRKGLGTANIAKTNVIVSSFNYDSQSIISEETGKKDFDFSKYLFVVNYQILYQTDNCYEECQ
jgi:hypothetical protein